MIHFLGGFVKTPGEAKLASVPADAMAWARAARVDFSALRTRGREREEAFIAGGGELDLLLDQEKYRVVGQRVEEQLGVSTWVGTVLDESGKDVGEARITLTGKQIYAAIEAGYRHFFVQSDVRGNAVIWEQNPEAFPAAYCNSKAAVIDERPSPKLLDARVGPACFNPPPQRTIDIFTSSAARRHWANRVTRSQPPVFLKSTVCCRPVA